MAVAVWLWLRLCLYGCECTAVCVWLCVCVRLCVFADVILCVPSVAGGRHCLQKCTHTTSSVTEKLPYVLLFRIANMCVCVCERVCVCVCV